MRRRTAEFRADRPVVAELAAGGVLVTPGGGAVLLLHQVDEDRWCFPKGHVENGESTEAAARREIAEETGLTGIELRGELLTVTYRFYDPGRDRSVVKTTVYFLGRARAAPLTLEPLFDRAQWCPVAEARALVPFDEEKQVVDALARSIAAGRA